MHRRADLGLKTYTMCMAGAEGHDSGQALRFTQIFLEVPIGCRIQGFEVR